MSATLLDTKPVSIEDWDWFDFSVNVPVDSIGYESMRQLETLGYTFKEILPLIKDDSPWDSMKHGTLSARFSVRRDVERLEAMLAAGVDRLVVVRWAAVGARWDISTPETVQMALSVPDGDLDAFERDMGGGMTYQDAFRLLEHGIDNHLYNDMLEGGSDDGSAKPHFDVFLLDNEGILDISFNTPAGNVSNEGIYYERGGWFPPGKYFLHLADEFQGTTVDMQVTHPEPIHPLAQVIRDIITKRVSEVSGLAVDEFTVGIRYAVDWGN